MSGPICSVPPKPGTGGPYLFSILATAIDSKSPTQVESAGRTVGCVPRLAESYLKNRASLLMFEIYSMKEEGVRKSSSLNVAGAPGVADDSVRSNECDCKNVRLVLTS
jgi:hypothetical protein